MERNEINNLIYGVPKEHDYNSCNALKEYEAYCKGYEDKGEKPPYPATKIQQIALEHNTSIPEMKKHWRCIEG